MTRVAGPAITGLVIGKKSASSPCSLIELRVVVVELGRDVARQLEVLLLVVADRHVRRLVEQDVGRHQRGIREKPERFRLGVLARGLVLPLRHAVHPAHPRDAVEHPGELGVLMDAGLVENDVLFGIDAGRDIGRGDLASRLPQRVGILPHGNRVHVDDAVDALLVRLLHLDVALDGAEVIAQMQVARRLGAGKDARSEGHGAVPSVVATDVRPRP